MKAELYEKLFARLDELGAIRKDVTLGCIIYVTFDGDTIHEIIFGEEIITPNPGEMLSIKGHPVVLSDCIKAHMMGDYTLKYNPRISEECQWLFDEWELTKQYLYEQSDELGEKLFELLS